MLIKLKNKDRLIVDDFKFKCSIGKNGVKKHKIEGDKSTPKGTYILGKVYYRSDRVEKPITKLNAYLKIFTLTAEPSSKTGTLINQLMFGTIDSKPKLYFNNSVKKLS